ncbi:MAG: mechanosensitive ion channel family protein [Hyphomicrobiaceae bacterium]|nr:mechanosensitive ion channel family protein [Hyphomicrobiaceae bacterium]
MPRPQSATAEPAFVVAQAAGAKPAATSAAAKPAAAAPATPPAPPAPPPAVEPAPQPSANETPAEPPAAPKPPAPAANLDPLLQPVRRLSAMLDDLEKAVERVSDREEELSKVRVEIDRLPGDARRAIEDIEPRLADFRSQVDKLGPAPKAEDPGEAEQIAEERARLNAVVSELDGAIKSAELASERARQLAQRVQGLRQSIFTTQLLRRTQNSPLKLSLWRTVVAEMPNAARDTATIARNWWRAAEHHALKLGLLLAFVTATYFTVRTLRRKLVRRTLNAQSDKPPSFFARAVTAGWTAAAYAFPAAAAAILLYLGVDNIGLLYLQVEALAETLLTSILIYVAVTALSRAILQPSRPHWRLFDLSDTAARRLHQITGAVAAVYAVDLVLGRFINVLYLPFQVNVAQAFVFSIAFAALLVMLARTRFEPRTAAADQPQVSFWHPWWLKVPLMTLALVIAGVSLAGYVALGRYISAQVVLSGTVIVVIMLLHLAVRAISGQAGLDEDSLSTRLLGERFKLDDTQRSMVDGFIFVVLNIAVALIAAPLLLFSWGFSSPEVFGWLHNAIFGFQLGGFQISLARILLAIVLFAAVIFATRILQRWMQSTVLRPAHIDAGLANSIHTGVGYAGFGIASLSAISYGGLDITNVAIVAGALSVGIGFGLQSIVNNFVSGLILLVERPIKVGDWIHVGEFEGHVRRISVRSTEIETFDRSSVIVPNSQLISGTVRNRTHRNTIGRVMVEVGVSYSADPAQVRDLLLRTAQRCPALSSFPAPFVLFKNFGASSLDFTIFGYISDVSKTGAAATELRIAVFQALRQSGIEIPFPQTDVHLRDLDVVKTLVARVIEERAAKKAAAVSDDDESVSEGPDAGASAGTGSAG